MLPPLFAARAQGVERRLEFRLTGAQFVFTAFGVNVDWFSQQDDRLREWVRNLRQVPALQLPAASWRDVKWEDRLTGHSGQKDRARFGLEPRPAGAINSESSRQASLETSGHLFERGARAFAGGATRRAIAAPLNGARDDLSVNAAAGHHDNAAPAPEPGGQKNALMPKRVDDLFACAFDLFVVMPVHNGPAHRATDQFDEPGQQEPGDPNSQSLLQWIMGEVTHLVDVIRQFCVAWSRFMLGGDGQCRGRLLRWRYIAWF